MIADFEAGVGTLTRAEPEQIDLVLIVVEPYLKSVDTAKRLLEIAAARGLAPPRLIANKVRSDEELAWISEALETPPHLVIPFDPAIAKADFEGISPLDLEASAPAVGAIGELAERICR